MWPVLIFILLALLVVADSLWRERRLRRQRLQAKQEFTQQLMAQQEKDYLHAQAQQRALFDSMADGVVILDRDGKVQLVNDSLRRQFDLRPGAAHGLMLAEAFQLPALADLAPRLADEKSIVEFELELPGTAPRLLEVNANPVRDREGAYQGAILVFHDQTRLKQLENTRKEFVANVSHELRTPLSLIKGFVETLLDGAKDDPECATRYLQTIQKHTDRLTYLIEDLLTISRLESGQGVLNLEDVNVRAVAQHLEDDLGAKAREKHIQIRNDLPPHLFAHADADRLEQVLFNLLENAIKYGRNNGQILIAGHASGPDLVEISVTDNGPGIPREAQARIFERFYRVDSARSRETGGTGLGLAIVKHIVLAHGGTAWVKSDPGQGASFHFTLPRASADPMAPASNQEAGAPEMKRLT